MKLASGAILPLVCALALADFYNGVAEIPSLESNDNRIGKEIGSFFNRVLSRAFSVDRQGYKCKRCRRATTYSGNQSTQLSESTVQGQKSTSNSSITQVTETVSTNLSHAICGDSGETTNTTLSLITTSALHNNNLTEFNHGENSTELNHKITSIEYNYSANSTLTNFAFNTNSTAIGNNSLAEKTETSTLVGCEEYASPLEVNENDTISLAKK